MDRKSFCPGFEKNKLMTFTGTGLVVHIVLGIRGLLLGPVAMLSRKCPGLHTNAGEVYYWVMAYACPQAYWQP
jgi:hypothetical protein